MRMKFLVYAALAAGLSMAAKAYTFQLRTLVPGDSSYLAGEDIPDGTRVAAGSTTTVRYLFLKPTGIDWSRRFLEREGDENAGIRTPKRVPLKPTSDPNIYMAEFQATFPTASGRVRASFRQVTEGGSLLFPGRIGVWLDVSVISRRVIGLTMLGEDDETDDAEITITQPKNVRVGQPVEVEVKVKNTGTTTFRAGHHYYALGVGKTGAIKSTAPALPLLDSSRAITNPDKNRAILRDEETVKPGQTFSFRFTLAAPSSPGLYRFDVRMLHEGAVAKGYQWTDGWFGPVRTIYFAAH